MDLSRRLPAVLVALGSAVAGAAAGAGPAQAAAGVPGRIPGAVRPAATEARAARLNPGAYPWRYGDPAADDGHGYYQDSCTSFAAWALRAHGVRGSAADNLGSAVDWQGRALDGRPRPGDIAQWDPWVHGADGYGHVAYVAAVHRNRVTVYEYNWADAFDGYRSGQLSVRTVPAGSPSRYLRF